MAELVARNLTVAYPVYHSGMRSFRRTMADRLLGRNLNVDGRNRVSVTALRGIDLELRDGDRLAIMGTNGAGKTTLLRALAGVYEPVSGRVETTGRRTALITPYVGLNLDATGRENIAVLAANMNFDPRALLTHADDIARWSELGSYIDLPLRTYSSGMVVRLAFATWTCIRPEILLMDEWLGVADASFLARAQKRLAGFVGSSSIMVLASHSTELLRRWCNRAILLENGTIVAEGTVEDVAREHAVRCDPAYQPGPGR